MTLSELRQEIQKRELKVGEILSAPMAILDHRFGTYFLLAILIFFPYSLIMEIFYSTVPAEPLLEDSLRVTAMQLLMNLFTMISLSITALMVENQLKTDEWEPFGTSFYNGLKRWPRFLATMLVVGLILGGVVFALTVGAIMLPFLMLPAMAFVMIAVMIGVVFIYNTCIASSLRGYMMMPCFNYVRSIIEGHLGKSLGVILLLTLISGLAAVPVVYCVSRVMVLVGNPVWTIVINTLVNTLVGVVNIYTNIGAVLYFINLEMLKYRELGAIE